MGGLQGQVLEPFLCAGVGEERGAGEGGGGAAIFHRHVSTELGAEKIRMPLAAWKGEKGDDDECMEEATSRRDGTRSPQPAPASEMREREGKVTSAPGTKGPLSVGIQRRALPNTTHNEK